MTRPSLILVHGAATGAWVWDRWRTHLSSFGWDVNVLDLRGHGLSLPMDLSTTTMEDYVADLESVTHQIEAVRGTGLIVGGWSMGGLVAQMYAATHPVQGLLLFSPSPPLEVAGKAPIEEIRKIPQGVFGPEDLGFSTSDFEAARVFLQDLTDDEVRRVMAQSAGAQESGMARRQRRRGISVPTEAIDAPVLLVYGDEDRQVAAEQNLRLADYFDAGTVRVAGAGHWGIVYSDALVSQTAAAVDAWLQSTFP